MSWKSALATVYGMMMSAKKSWNRLSGHKCLPEVVRAVEFRDGIKQLKEVD